MSFSRASLGGGRGLGTWGGARPGWGGAGWGRPGAGWGGGGRWGTWGGARPGWGGGVGWNRPGWGGGWKRWGRPGWGWAAAGLGAAAVASSFYSPWGYSGYYDDCAPQPTQVWNGWGYQTVWTNSCGY